MTGVDEDEIKRRAHRITFAAEQLVDVLKRDAAEKLQTVKSPFGDNKMTPYSHWLDTEDHTALQKAVQEASVLLAKIAPGLNELERARRQPYKGGDMPLVHIRRQK